MSFLSYNIDGISTIYQPDVISFLSSYDFVFLSETFAAVFPSDLFPLFDVFISAGVRVSDNPRSRLSGGVAMLIKKSLSLYVKQIPLEFDNCISLRLFPQITGLKTENILIGMYIPPSQSVYYQDTEIENGICMLEQCILDAFELCGDLPLILMGDFNARTGNANARDIPLFSTFPFETNDFDDSEKEHYPRKSKDTVINDFGRYLLDVCEQFSLLILNGFLTGDSEGNYTYIAHNGASVIDYFLMSRSIIDCALNLRVVSMIESKHMPIEFLYSIPLEEGLGSVTKERKCAIERYVWNDKNKDVFIEKCMSREATGIFEEALSLISIDIDLSLSKFYEGLSLAGQCMKKGVKICPIKVNPWFDLDCRIKRSELRKSLRKYKACKDKENADKLKIDYVEKRREYKGYLEKKKAEDKRCILDILEKNMHNAKTFWGTIKERIGYKRRHECSISEEEWFRHFHNVFNDIIQDDTAHGEGDYRESVRYHHYVTNNDLDSSTLDVEISESEVRDAIKTLKFGKAAGPDGFSGEFYKHSSPLVVSYLTKLFNELFNSGTFPLSWSEAIIIPLHKKGDLNSPDNYRGISLLNISGKLYTFILNKRLTSWVEENNLLSESQAGFRKEYSTVDHLFTLLTLIQKQLSSGKKLYAAFIDFKKAFDMIDRNHLWTVLHKNGIQGKMYKAIKSMYQVVIARVRTNNNVTESFVCPRGLRQGDNCSPLLFSLFINELANDIAQHGKHGIYLSPDVIQILILLFADDVVLFSSTVVGLQRQLDILCTSAKRLSLHVNYDKSKIIIFRNGGYIASREKWNFAGVNLEIVNKYKYLGITFSTGLTFSYALEEMAAKAKRGVYNILRFLWSLGENNPTLFFKMFDTQIQPILTYGSEVWGLTADHKPIETIHLLAIKRLLNVSIKTPNTLVYCETGRYPLYIITFTKAIKYWLKLTRMNNERIPKKSYNMLLKLHNNEKKNWLSKVRSTLYKYGFGHVWENGGVQNVNNFVISFKQRLFDCHIQDLDSAVMSKERFQFYSSFRLLNGVPTYLNTIRNPVLRKHLTRLRLGVSNLKPHRFRYTNNENTTCPFCPDTNESELHFILLCPHYANLREQFIPTKYYSRPNAFKLTLLLSNMKLCTALAMFLSKAFYARNHYTV